VGALKIFTSRKQTMKHSIFLKLLAVSLLAVVVATGCKKTPKNVTPIHGQPTRVGAGTGGPPIVPDTNPNPPLLTPGSGLPATGTQGIGTTPIGGTPVPPPFNPNVPPGGGNAGDLREFDGHWADASVFAANTIQFDYDKAIVKASELGKLQPVIAALKASPQNKLLIEGHCDERGTEEYNRALGERRALAIRERLAKSGISPDRLRTMSYGEDKPAELGHTESAWAKNRRGELVLLKPKN
jgi:peptidoglycan-associated lipoprotein